MTDPKTYVVFEPHSTLLQVIDVADDNGWTQAEHFRRGERQLEELVYELPDGETVVRGIDDHFVFVTIAKIVGPRRDDAERKLRSDGRSIDEVTLWLWTKSEDPEQRSFALRAFAAISERTTDPRVIALYQQSLGDPDPSVRKALIDSVGRVAWRAMWPLVDELAKSDGDDGDASRVLKEAYQLYVPRS